MSVDFLPVEMQPYTFVHGHPTLAFGAADDVAADGPWVRARFRCASAAALLARIAVDGVITVDCALFAQLVMACRRGVDGTIVLGTGPTAMQTIAVSDGAVCALALPKPLYDRFKHQNSESAQYLVGPDADGQYVGLAASPKRATLAQWRTYLRDAFCERARNSPDGAAQLAAAAADTLHWQLVSC